MEKDSTGGMEKNSNYITNTNNINNTAAAPLPPESSAGPPGDGESAAAALFDPQDLKKALQGLDKALVLDDAFYPRAGAFMARHGLDSGYLKWLCRQCENKESPANYLFKTFLLDTKAGQYKALRQAAAESRPPPDADCPVCGTLHAKGDAVCPICGLPKDSVPERILFLRGLWDYSPARHGEYLSREKEIADGCGLKDYVRHKSLLENLQKEFSLETA
jgi:hypothetical protein